MEYTVCRELDPEWSPLTSEGPGPQPPYFKVMALNIDNLSTPAPKGYNVRRLFFFFFFFFGHTWAEKWHWRLIGRKRLEMLPNILHHTGQPPITEPSSPKMSIVRLRNHDILGLHLRHFVVVWERELDVSYWIFWGLLGALWTSYKYADIYLYIIKVKSIT